jgi:hypothetical protein
LVVGTDVVVATENNSIYELNATTGQVLWHTNFGTPVDGSKLPCGDINPSGITSTPAIDVTGRTIYAVAYLQSPQMHHELFAVNLDTGTIKFQEGVDPSSPNFTVKYQQQRAALALANGYVYVPYGGLDGDCGPYHGWLAATNVTDVPGGGSLIAYQVPTGRAGAIWGGGDGPVVDQSGNLLVATGNSDATSSFDYGDAVLKLSSATATPPLSLLDYFAPSNWAQLNSGDIDLGSTEPVVLSTNDLFQIGKEGVGYVLNAASLGGIGGQLYSSQVCNGGAAFGGLAYSSPYLTIPCDNGLVALKVSLGSSPPYTVAWRGPNYQTGPPIIAGNSVWDVDSGNGLLYAFNLTTGHTMFSATIGSVPTHFTSLSSAYGQIFVAANSQLRAYVPQQGTTTTMTVSYHVVGGGSGYSAPVFHYVLNGVSQSLTLPKLGKAVTVDTGSTWSVTPNPLTGSSSSQRWISSQPLTGTASATTIVFTFQHQFFLTMTVNGPGTVTPSSGWNNQGAKVTIKATAKPGHKFKSWTGTGIGSFSGTSPTHTITMSSAITETANFT